MAFTWSLNFPIHEFYGINNGICYYVPWYVVRISGADSLMLRKDFAEYFFSYVFTLLKDTELKRIKPYKQQKTELKERNKILIGKSKDNIHNQTAPILKSYPRWEMPRSNPSSICMPQYVYYDLKLRVVKERIKEKKQGIKFREPITIPRDLTYPKERIREEVNNYNFIEGTYDSVMKIEELAIAFTNFFLQHSLEEATDLLVGLLKTSLILTQKWFQKAKKYILKRRPGKEKDLFELEKNGYEKTVYALLFKEDEHIIAHFKGRVILPKAHVEFPGHVMVTNYRVLGPNLPGDKTIEIPVTGVVSGLIVSAIASVVAKHIIKARKQFLKVFSQNLDMFVIQNPYDIEINSRRPLSFAMNYEYMDEKTSEKKIYEHVIRFGFEKYNNESHKDYEQRKKKDREQIRGVLEEKSQISYR